MQPLVIITIVYGLIFIPTVYLAMVSPMLFDAGFKGVPWSAWVIFGSMISLPVVMVIGLMSGFLLYFYGHPTAAWMIALIPIMNIVALVLGWMVTALVWRV